MTDTFPRPQILSLSTGQIHFPIFLPDATQGVVRSVDVIDLQHCQIEALVMNTFHLMQRPGSSTIRSLGGLHKMTGWPFPIVTDSGGFQVYSLIHNKPNNGSLTERGIIFHPEGLKDKILLTPEKTVQLQLGYRSDVVICLDECTHPDAPMNEQETAVARTLSWAKRCRVEFDHQLETRKMEADQRPLLFAVIQGGNSQTLRKQCAEELLQIGFDGFGFGGWPMDGQGNLLLDMFYFLRQLIPQGYPLHALGVGHPESIASCYRAGWDLFDSALPTRDARRGRLYALIDTKRPIAFTPKEDWFSVLYIEDQKYIKNTQSIFSTCDCLTCQHYSLGFLHHLYKIKDSLYLRLATIHNLRFMSLLCTSLRAEP